MRGSSEVLTWLPYSRLGFMALATPRYQSQSIGGFIVCRQGILESWCPFFLLTQRWLIFGSFVALLTWLPYSRLGFMALAMKPYTSNP